MASIVATLFTNGGRVGMVVIMHSNHDEPNVENIQGFDFENIQDHIIRIK